MAKTLKTFGWYDLLDKAEQRLKKLVPKDQAKCMTDRADSHSPWFEESREREDFTELDIARLVDWLIARKDDNDFKT